MCIINTSTNETERIMRSDETLYETEPAGHIECGYQGYEDDLFTGAVGYYILALCAVSFLVGYFAG